jgi:ATP synthase protein I
MTGSDDKSRLDSLGQRIDAAKGKRERRLGGTSTQSPSDFGLGLRIATELVAAIGVSVAIGIGLDRWLGTSPGLLILFFILGSAAGFRNVIRVAHNHEAARKREKDANATVGKGAAQGDGGHKEHEGSGPR